MSPLCLRHSSTRALHRLPGPFKSTTGCTALRPNLQHYQEWADEHLTRQKDPLEDFEAHCRINSFMFAYGRVGIGPTTPPPGASTYKEQQQAKDWENSIGTREIWKFGEVLNWWLMYF